MDLSEIAEVTPLPNTFGGMDDQRVQVLALFDVTKTPKKKAPKKAVKNG